MSSVSQLRVEPQGRRGNRRPLPITAVVLAFNEETNLEACLDSIAGWTEAIFVVDSGARMVLARSRDGLARL